MKFLMTILILLFGVSLLTAQERTSKSQTNPAIEAFHNRQLGFHNWSFWLNNEGAHCFDQAGNDPNSPAGSKFPRNSGNSVIYEAGFWLGVLKDPAAQSPFRYSVSQYRSNAGDFGPGPILNSNVPFDSLHYDEWDDTDNVVYLIDTSRSGFSWDNWPDHDGAPLDSMGEPLLVSQEDSWTVFNDADTAWHLDNRYAAQGDTLIPGIGIEVQQSSYEFAVAPNAVFIRFKVTNHTNVIYDDSYIGVGVDPDVGLAGNDQMGTDTLKNMIFMYNQFTEGTTTGHQYAVGYKPLYFSEQGVHPKISVSSVWINGFDPPLPPPWQPINDSARYNYMRGVDIDGTPRLISEGLVDVNGSPYVFPGDPVAGTGVLSNGVFPNGRDLRMLLALGPFQLEPDTAYDFIISFFGGEAPTRLGAITDLRNEADHIHSLFEDYLDYFLGVDSFIDGVGPVAAFSPTYFKAGPAPFTVTFTDFSITKPGLPITSWQWDFDNDGTFDSFDKNPIWTYTQDGDYSVKLVVTNAEGSDTLTKENLITAFGTIAIPFFEQFEIAPEPDPSAWITLHTRVSDQSVNPPSVPYAIAIDGHPLDAESITSYPFDLTNQEDSTIVLCFSYQPEGNGNQPGPEDSLIVELRNSLDKWIQIRGFPGESLFPFKTDTVFLDSVDNATSGTLFFDTFQFRFRGTAESSGSLLKDVWFVDDVFLGKLQDRPTGISTSSADNLPRRFKLHQNYPNPFNPTTKIKYDLPKDSKVTIKIYNVLGQEVRTLVDEPQTAGFRSVVWNGKNDAGNAVSSGVYVYRIEAGGFVQSRKMMLLR